MTNRIVFGSKVEADLTESYDYYEEQLSGLGAEFLLSVEAALYQIERSPLHFQKVYGNKRKVNLKRFPFGIFYIFSKETVLILAVIHLTRDPKTWKKRRQ
jgi:hypothetical protein